MHDDDGRSARPLDTRPSDRAGPRSVAVLSVHTSPLAQPGTGDSGGMNVYLSSTTAAMARRGLDVDVFTRVTGADLPPTVTTADGVRVHHLPAGPPSARKGDLPAHLCAFAFGLRAHPRFVEADVVHGHYWLSGWVARRLLRRAATPFVQSFHTLAREKNAALAVGEEPESGLRLAGEERVARDADAIVAPTAHEGEVLVGAYGAAPRTVHVIPPGVDLGVFTPAGDGHGARRSLGGGRLLLFVGRLQPLKAPDVAIRTLAELDALLPDDGVPTRLVVCGGPSGNGVGRSDVPRLRRLAAELGVADRVAFLTPRPQCELAALYRAADVLLMPSRSESFGLVALEAQACGTPVVATDVGGLRRAVTSGGVRVAGHEPADHARAALPLLTDPRARARASAAALDHARRHGWERTVDATLQLYRSLRQRGHLAGAQRDARGA